MADIDEQTPLVANPDSKNKCLMTAVNLQALLFSLLTVLMLACFPIAMSIGFQTRQPAKTNDSSEHCVSVMNDTDLRRFIDIFKDREKYRVDLVYVHLNINGSYNNCINCDALMPSSWVWASASTGRVFKYWQEDYSVWSFGMLDLYTERNVNLTLHVPEGCSLDLGVHSTMDVIAKVLNNLTYEALGTRYKGSLWCYKSRLNRSSPIYELLERNFRHFILDVENRCCQYSPKCRTCNKNPLFLSTVWTIIPFAISYIFLLYSPVIFVYFVHWLLTISPIPWLSWGKDVTHDHSHHLSDYIYVEFDSPVSFTSMVGDVTDWILKKLPKCCVRLRIKHVLMILASPFVIFMKVWIYHSNKELHKLMTKLVKLDIPVGFSSMTFNFKDKSVNYLTLFYGPCIFFLMYYILGIGFVCFNTVMRNNISFTFDPRQSYVPLSTLNLHLFKSLGNKSLKHKTLNIIAENTIEHSLSSSFWKEVWRGYRRDTPLFFSFLNFVTSFIVHQLPFLFTSHLILRSYMHAVSKEISHTVCRKCPKFGFCLAFVLCFILGSCHFVLSFAVATILFSSLEFVALVITFSFVTLVMYPAESQGYFLFGSSALIFLSRCFRGIAHKYQHLLFLTVEASIKIRKQILKQNPDDSVEYLRHVNGCYGIPRELFEDIIAVYEPRKYTFVKAVFKKFVVGSFLAWLLYLIVNLHEGHTAVDQLVKAFTAFVIISIPELLSLLMKDTHQQTEDTIRKNHLKYTIQKYWDSRHYRDRAI